MRVRIIDSKALEAISPSLLSAYASSSGWENVGTYRDCSDVYAREGGDEIIVPRTQEIADYARVVSQLIDIFADHAESDQLAIYRDLITADRDVIRVRADEGDNDSTVAVDTGVELVGKARDMLHAAACSVKAEQPHYHRDAIPEAADYMRRVRLGQTEQRSFVITLLSPVVELQMPAQAVLDRDIISTEDPMARQVTRRLSDALTATQTAVKRANRGDDDAFRTAIHQGVSANLCEALAGLVEPVSALDVSMSCARTLPSVMERSRFRFSPTDADILHEAARQYRKRQPPTAVPETELAGFVRKLERAEGLTEGTVVLHTKVQGRQRSVKVRLDEAEYHQAIDAHRQNWTAVVAGNLESTANQSRLSNARLVKVINSGEQLPFRF